jgi:hypothetical protein
MAKNTISIYHYICRIFHLESNLSKLQFNLAHFISPILILHGPAPLSQNEVLSPSGITLIINQSIYPSMDLAQFHGTLFGFHPTALSLFTFFRNSNF